MTEKEKAAVDRMIIMILDWENDDDEGYDAAVELLIDLHMELRELKLGRPLEHGN